MVSIKHSKIKNEPTQSAAGKAALEAARNAERVFDARYKFERLLDKWYQANGYISYFKLVSDPGDDGEEGEKGEFESEELALVPTEQLDRCLPYLEETEEVLRTMIEEIKEALEARTE